MAPVESLKSRDVETIASTGRDEGRTGGPHFIRAIIENDLQAGVTDGRVATRFPPEPNGYLHIGHAKAICLNFGLARDYNGRCHLRFDDTNPTTEDLEYVRAIQEDVRWLGFDWGEHLYYASDYFDALYEYALQLIRDGKAYVDSQNEEEIRAGRGSVTEPGLDSPYRNRSVEENLDLFTRMRAGEFPDGAHVLRAKIDMAAPNMKMRDPLLYRIRHAHHYRTGDAWPIYPMYDFAHPLSDAVEDITHSLCTLEFENNRELYDWVVDNTRPPPRPHQYEFARLSLDYTVTSKRKLLRLVKEGYVSGWDDPRMPTLSGMRRRGYTPEAIRNFCDRIGVARADNRVDMSLLEYSIRDDLNHRAPRVMGVLQPLRVVLTNYPEDRTEELEASYWPHDIPKEGTRTVPFSRVLYIEREDFMEHPPKKFHRLAPGREVRLRYAYIIKCEEVVKDAGGEVVELRCTYDPATLSGTDGDPRKVKGTIHWVSAAHAVPVEVRLYDRLFTVANPDDTEEDQTFLDFLNPHSVEVLTGSVVEPSVAGAAPGTRFQFERQGYFIADTVDSKPDALVFNRIVTLRDTWAKIARGGDGHPAGSSETAEPTSPASTGTGDAPPPAQRTEAEIRAAALARAPELAERFTRYTDTFGLTPEDADLLASDLGMARFFENALAAHAGPKAVAAWILNELLRELKDTPLEDLPFGGADLGRLVALIEDDTLSGRLAKEVFAAMIEGEGTPEEIVERRGLRQVSDVDALAPVVDRVLGANEDKVAQYRAGKTGLMGFFVGQIMRETQGKANPQLVRDLVAQRLG